jgi:hypothetical protein
MPTFQLKVELRPSLIATFASLLIVRIPQVFSMLFPLIHNISTTHITIKNAYLDSLKP